MTAVIPKPASPSYFVQTYIKGSRSVLRADQQIPCLSEAHARVRAEKIMTAGHVLGVDVVRQSSDPDAGEYGEPEYLVRLGQVPEIG